MTDTPAAQYDRAETDSLLRTSDEYQQRHFYKLAAQLAACDARLAECEKERDELRQKLKGRVLGIPVDENTTAWAMRCCELEEKIGTLKPGQHPDEINPRGETWLQERENWEAEVAQLRTALASSRALVAAKDEALKATLPFFEEDMPDGPDGELGIVTVAYRRAFKQVVMALALTPATCAGTLVDAAELSELRRDRERLDWLTPIFEDHDYFGDPWLNFWEESQEGSNIRAAIDNAARAGKAAP